MRPLMTHWLTHLLTLSILIWSAAESDQLQAGNTTFSGDATAVRATVLGTTTVLSETGPLPSSGGALEANLLTANVPGVLTAQVLHAATVGQGNKSRSEASVATSNLTVGGNTITANLLMARAEASCSKGRASVSGGSEVVGLVINNTAIAVSGAPNQTVSLPNGQVVINEQSSSASGNSGDFTVTALHVTVNGIADVLISTVHADINCGGSSPCAGDFITGGGWITGTPSGAKGNFGVAGGIKKSGALWGHLTYHDHGSGGPSVKGTGVTAYSVIGDPMTSTSRHIEGTCEINGASGFTYSVDLADHGEPGRSDTFSLTLSNGYSASGTLTGGNIQLHVCK